MSRRPVRTPIAYWSLATVLVLLSGCSEPPRIAADVAASIDEEPLPYRQFETFLRKNLDQSGVVEDETAARVQSSLFDQFLDEQLLQRLAVDRGVLRRPGMAGDAVSALLDQSVGDDIDPQRIEDYFRTHRERWTQSAQVRLWQILVPERTMAEAAERELDGGASFTTVATQLAENPDAGYCGDQGWLAHEDLPPALADAIFALRPGSRSDVLEADYGYYLFLVEDTKPATELPRAAVESTIRETLLAEDRNQRLGAYLQEARDRYNVEIFRANLPFEYRGSYADNPT